MKIIASANLNIPKLILSFFIVYLVSIAIFYLIFKTIPSSQILINYIEDMGVALIVALLISIIISKKGKPIQPVIFSFLLFIFTFVIYVQQLPQRNKVGDESRQAFKHALRQLSMVAKENFEKNKVLTNEQITEMNLGIYSDIYKMLNAKKEKIQDDFLQYDKLVEKRLNKALDPNTLADKKLRSIYKENLVLVKEKVKVSNEHMNKLLTDFEQEVSIKKLPSEQRSTFLSGFKKGVKITQKYWQEIYELESQILNTMLNIYLFLDKHDGQFSLDNDQLSFNDDVIMNGFNDLVNTIDKISKRRDILDKDYQDTLQSKYKEVESYLKTP